MSELVELMELRCAALDLREWSEQGRLNTAMQSELEQLHSDLTADSAEIAPLAASDARARGQIEMNGYRLEAIPQEMALLRAIHPQNLSALHARTQDTVARCNAIIGHYAADDPAVVDLVVSLNGIQARHVNIHHLTTQVEANRHRTEEAILHNAESVLEPVQKFLTSKL